MATEGQTDDAKRQVEQYVNQHRNIISLVIQKLRWTKTIVTVEPLIAFYQMALYVSKPALDNLELEKSCRVNLYFNDTVCDAILRGHQGRYPAQNAEIQIAVSNMYSWQQPLQGIVPLVLALFIGSYSDLYKWRKPFFLLPILGELAGNLGCMLCVVFMDTWPLEVQGLLRKVVPSLFGGATMVVMATTAYVADVSSVETRTFRLGIIQIVISVTSPLAASFSGILFLETGYFGVLSLSSAMLAVSFIYGVFWIQGHQTENKLVKCDMLTDMFNPKHAMDTMSMVFRKTRV